MKKLFLVLPIIMIIGCAPNAVVETPEQPTEVNIEEIKEQLKEEIKEEVKEEIKQEEMEKERKQYEARIKHLEEQIAIKDKRMDEQAERFNRKDEQYTELVNRLLNCHCCNKGE